MKTKNLQVRVSLEEKVEILKRCEESGMSASDYIRATLLGTPIYQNGSAQKAMSHLCRMFTVLNKMEEYPEAEELRKELNAACRDLQS